MLFRCLTSSESDDGSCECSAIYKQSSTSKLQKDRSTRRIKTKKSKIENEVMKQLPETLYKPERSTEILADGGGAAFASSNCSTKVPFANPEGREEQRRSESDGGIASEKRRRVEARRSKLLNISKAFSAS